MASWIWDGGLKMKTVTERDFRRDEFKDSKPEDYEFRDDGVIVRKDRWEHGMRAIASILGVSRDFEIVEIVAEVNRMYATFELPVAPEELK